MKKILLSVAVIAVVAAIAIGGTIAFFSDDETSTGNTFTTGTVSIAVDGNEVWSGKYDMPDMKPSQTDYIDFVIHNTGNDPVNIYKTLLNFAGSEDGTTNEPECSAEDGTWTNGQGCSGGQRVFDLQNKINYDLRVELYATNPTGGDSKLVWWETIYQDSDNVKIGSLPNEMFLGMIPEGWYMKVMQSYHMPSSTDDNKYQGDKLTFDIKLKAEQLTGTLVLENKYEANTDVSHHVWLNGGGSDGKDATLTYVVKDRTFDYTLVVNGMGAGPYTLIAWEDSPNWNWGTIGTAKALANVTGNGTFTGSINLNANLTNAKIWLVPGTFTVGQTIGSLGWNPTNMLFETGLIDYYDADKI